MRIGVVVDNAFDNDHRVQKEVRLLIEAGHHVFILCLDYGGTYKSYSEFEVNRISINENIKNGLVILNTNFSFYNNFWAKHISSFIVSKNIEVLHVHDLYMSKPGHLGIKKAQAKIPLIVDLHENYPAAITSYRWATQGWRKFVVTPIKWFQKESKFLAYADAIVTLSNSFKKDLLQRFGFLKSDQIFVHPNMPDFDSFQAFETSGYEVEFNSSLPTLFYFGVVAKRRGIIDILPWLCELKEEGLKFHILIIGPVDKADKNDFENNVLALGENATYISWSDVKYLPAYLKKITVGLAPFEVNPQHDSGVANKLFQYMYGKVPMLATACKAQKELLTTANCGLVYEGKQDFKDKVIQLVNSPSLCQNLGENGHRELLRLYQEKTDRAFLEIYDKDLN